ILIAAAGPHRGIGLSSDKLSSNEMTSIVQQVRLRCIAESLTACAVLASRKAADQAKADEAASNRNAAIFWALVLLIMGAVIVLLVFAARRRHLAFSPPLDEPVPMAGGDRGGG